MQIVLENYTPHWAERFTIERDKIYKVIDFLRPNIEHIGSTSIINMIAKPIIDILVGIPSKNHFNDTVTPLISLGYTYIRKFEEEAPNRRFFIFFDNVAQKIVDFKDDFPSENQSRRFHVHVFEYKSNDWIRHIAFRDFLKFHDSEMNRYKKFKSDLRAKDFEGTLDYGKFKNEFMIDLEAKALNWYKNQNSFDRRFTLIEQ